MVVARAILGEWLGGSGGGWQDSGGIFPGIKLIQGVAGRRGRPRVGRQPGPAPARPSAARPAATRERRRRRRAATFPEALAESLVLVHGGMAQNVGPILNMVTEKYLLRGRAEWLARREALEIFDEIVARVQRPDVRGARAGDDPELGRAAQADHPLGDQRVHRDDHPRGAAALGDDFWGFLMLGGMSGGGMAFFVAPAPARRVPGPDRRDHAARQGRRSTTPCPSPWSRSSTTSGSTRTGRSPRSTRAPTR